MEHLRLTAVLLGLDGGEELRLAEFSLPQQFDKYSSGLGHFPVS